MCFNSFVVSFNVIDDKILLSDVTALSFQANKYTTGRRNAPISQLYCEGGYCSEGPDNVMCKNMGRGDKDFVWECTGYGLTPGYKLGQSDVGCEGYDFPNDPYILKGSCGVFYTVVKGSVPATTTTSTTTTSTVSENIYAPYRHYNTYDGGEWLFIALVIICSVVLIVAACNIAPYPLASASATATVYPVPAPWYYPRTWYGGNSYQSYYVPPATYGGIRTTTTTTTNNTSSSNSTSDPTTSTTSGNTRRR